MPVDEETKAIMTARHIASEISRGKKRITKAEMIWLAEGFQACDRLRASANIQLQEIARDRLDGPDEGPHTEDRDLPSREIP